MPSLPDRIEAGEFNPTTYYSKETREAYKADQKNCEARFKEALRVEMSYKAGKQWDVFFEKAWEDGHAAGYYEVITYAEVLEDFLVEWLAAKES